MVLEAGGSRPLVHPINLKGFPKYRFSVLLQVTRHKSKSITAWLKMTALMCRHFYFHTRTFQYTFHWCLDGVTAACVPRQPRGAGSIPVHGSNKTNDEVVAKLLTWKWRARKTSSSQDRQGNLSVLLYLTLIAVFSSWRNAVWKFRHLAM